MHSLFCLSLLLVGLIAVPCVSQAKPSSKAVKDAGLIFQDEVSQKIIVDLKHGSETAEHAFSDLEGRLIPGTKEYVALVHVIEQDLKADQNIEVPSLSELRKKFDEAFGRFKMVAATAVEKSSARLPASAELQFSLIPEAGYIHPSLKGYRLIPLETGAMLVSESGDKRVFGFRGAKVGDKIEVSVRDNLQNGSLLALRCKESVWLIYLSQMGEEELSKIDWSKQLEFQTAETAPTAEQSLKVIVEEGAISVKSGLAEKRLSPTSGRVIVDEESGEVATTSAPVRSENREPAASENEKSSIVQPIEE